MPIILTLQFEYADIVHVYTDKMVVVVYCWMSKIYSYVCYIIKHSYQNFFKLSSHRLGLMCWLVQDISGLTDILHL